MRPEIANIILNHRCKMEMKGLKIYDHYRPNYKTPLLSEKFYARHETFADVKCDPEVLRRLSYEVDTSIKAKRKWPETHNQSYGWFTEPFTDYDKRDLIHFPRTSTEVSKIGLMILEQDTALRTKKHR